MRKNFGFSLQPLASNKSSSLAELNHGTQSKEPHAN
jgi:hypothetical protein